jgi:replicative DNA helicase
VANVGSVDAQALRLATVDHAQIDSIVRATHDASKLDDIFRLVYRPGLSVNALARLVRRLQRRPGVPPLRLLVVDYLQLLSAPGCGNNREQEIAQISAALTLIAKRENLCVMALSQMNADGQARESRKIEQDADVVVTLKPADPENETPDTNAVYDMLVQKNRHGLTTGAGKWRMVFSKRFQRFHEIEADNNDNKPRNNWRGEEERED